MGFNRKPSQPRDFKFPSKFPAVPESAPDEIKSWWDDAMGLIRDDHQQVEDALASLKGLVSATDQTDQIKALQDAVAALKSAPAAPAVQNVVNEITTVGPSELTKDQKDALKGTAGTPSDGNRYVTFLDSRFSAIGKSTLPIGVVMDFAGGAIPDGWLLCDGSEVIRSGYPGLFAVIGVTYGAGDGSTTFNLPDCRGRSPMGAGTGAGLTARTLGAKLGEEGHTLIGAESGLPAHTHNVGWRDNSCAGGSDNNTGSMTSGPLLPVATSSTGPLDASQAHNTVHPVIVFNSIIKF